MRTFKLYTVAEFDAYIASVQVAREINHIQIHHTAAPTLAGYLASKSREGVIRAMWAYHTATRGWQDIAQHFSIAPDGIWDGRSLELKPAGFLGVQNNGGLMFEIIGYFDVGAESFSGDIADMTYKAVAACRRRWPNAEIRFHRDQAGANKTCPGSAIVKTAFVSEVEKRVSRHPVDVLIANGVAMDATRWKAASAANSELMRLMTDLAENWDAYRKIEYCGALVQKIGSALG